jgi:hypothetical protein
MLGDCREFCEIFKYSLEMFQLNLLLTRMNLAQHFRELADNIKIKTFSACLIIACT